MDQERDAPIKRPPDVGRSASVAFAEALREVEVHQVFPESRVLFEP